MVIVKIMEGLGNQLFEYACARRLALFKNIQLKFDISDYQKINYPRKYKLNHFNIHENFASDKEIQGLKKYKPRGGARGFFYNIFNADSKKYFKEKQIFKYDSSILDTNLDVYLEGYWQSYKYFIEIEELLKKEFVLKKEISSAAKKIWEKTSNPNTVSLHIRRGDYKNPNLPHRLLPTSYYQQAIQIMSQKIKHPRFFVFSDEIDWVRQNLKLPAETMFVSDPNLQDYEEIFLMSSTHHNIIANSSFSWWPAWLNGNQNKIVIAPKQWFKDEKISTTDLLPPQWLILDI